MTNYVIEKDVPIPAPEGRGRPRKYPFGDMAIGDSFEVEVSREVISPAASYYGSRNGKSFSVRTCADKTIRVWRVK